MFSLMKSLSGRSNGSKRFTLSIGIFIILATSYLRVFTSSHHNYMENVGLASVKKIKVEKAWDKEPSNLQVCRTIINAHLQQSSQTDQSDIKANNANNSNDMNKDPINVETTQFIVQEHESLCFQVHTPTASLLQIFTSAFLARQAAVHGINIRYYFNCDTFNALHPFIFSQLFFSNNASNKNDNMEVLSLDNLLQLCHQNLAKDSAMRLQQQQPQQQKLHQSLHGTNMLFTSQIEDREGNQRSLLDYALPFIRSTFIQTANHYKLLNHDVNQAKRVRNGDSGTPKAFMNYFNSVFQPIESNHDNIDSNEISNDTEEQTIKIQKNSAAIYLPCLMDSNTKYDFASYDDRQEQQLCTDAVVLPYHVYLSNIPTSVAAITVIVQEGCFLDRFANDKHEHHIPVHFNPRVASSFSPVCEWHAKELVSFLKSAYPRSVISLVVDHPSTMEIMLLLLESEYLLCGPGTNGDDVVPSRWAGEMACFFPVLVRSSTQKIENVDECSRTMLMPPQSYQQHQGINFPQTETSVFSAISGHLPPSSLRNIFIAQGVLPQHESQAMHLLPLASSHSKHNFGLIVSFLNLPPPVVSKCLSVRGKIGLWTQDMDYAASSAQYKDKLRHYSGQTDILFKRAAKHGETNGLQYRPSTTYRWIETSFNISPSTMTIESGNDSVEPHVENCDVELITLDRFCTVLQSMNIRKLFFLGDSLMLQQAQSLWKLLDQSEQPTTLFTLEPNFSHTISCPNHIAEDGQMFQFRYQFVRNDQLSESSRPVSIDENIKNCGNAFCYPWIDQYMADSNQVRALVLVSLGLHVPDITKFQEIFDGFFYKLDELNRLNDGKREKDLIFFRTAVPGHWGCEKEGLIPFESYQDYEEFVASDERSQIDRWNWKGLFEYNNYAIRAIDNRNYNRNIVDGSGSVEREKEPHVEVLDVLPMTILRRDGHLGDEFKPPQLPEGDCLHYALPGPVDWWNHLLYSNLRDLAVKER